MNETINALEQALKLLRKTRIDAYQEISNTGLMKVMHAENHINKQLAEMVGE